MVDDFQEPARWRLRCTGMDFAAARQHMVESQIARRGVRDLALLDAMREVPREAFVGAGFEKAAYEDMALPIAEDQTISQPYIVAVMLEAAGLKSADRVLEVGAGSGYAAAIISRIVDRVFAIERQPDLAEAMRERLQVLGYPKIDLKTGDGSQGWLERAPFDAIIVSAGAPRVPHALRNQLAQDGRLVIPVGTADQQRLLRITRHGRHFKESDLGAVHFVRLIGTGGWPDE